MLRRSFLTGITSAALSLARRPIARAQEPERLRISIEVAATGGRQVPPDFIGLSYESAILADEDYVSPDNTSLIGLIRRLGRAGVLRIGGNTSEDTIWNPSNQDSGARPHRPHPGAHRPVGRAGACTRLEAHLRPQSGARHAASRRRGGGLCGARARPRSARISDRQRARRVWPLAHACVRSPMTRARISPNGVHFTRRSAHKCRMRALPDPMSPWKPAGSARWQPIIRPGSCC